MQHASTFFPFRLSAVLAAIAIVVACSGSETPGTGAPGGADGGSSDAASADDAAELDGAVDNAHKVDVTNFVYSPKKLTIKVGDTVAWTFKTGTHTVTSGAACKKDGRFDSGVHKSPFTFRHTFDAAGTFEYFCDYMDHCGKGQVGTIVVE